MKIVVSRSPCPTVIDKSLCPQPVQLRVISPAYGPKAADIWSVWSASSRFPPTIPLSFFRLLLFPAHRLISAAPYNSSTNVPRGSGAAAILTVCLVRLLCRNRIGMAALTQPPMASVSSVGVFCQIIPHRGSALVKRSARQLFAPPCVPESRSTPVGERRHLHISFLLQPDNGRPGLFADPPPGKGILQRRAAAGSAGSFTPSVVDGLCPEPRSLGFSSRISAATGQAAHGPVPPTHGAATNWCATSTCAPGQNSSQSRICSSASRRRAVAFVVSIYRAPPLPGLKRRRYTQTRCRARP